MSERTHGSPGVKQLPKSIDINLTYQGVVPEYTDHMLQHLHKLSVKQIYILHNRVSNVTMLRSNVLKI